VKPKLVLGFTEFLIVIANFLPEYELNVLYKLGHLFYWMINAKAVAYLCKVTPMAKCKCAPPLII